VNAPANIQHDSDAKFRQSVVGASEVAALFDASPWLTRFELWHRKNGTIATPEFNAVVNGQPENERIYWGVKLEPVVIEGACERWGYERLETPARLTNGAGLGGHPDCLVRCPERGRGIIEVKTVDWLQEKKWGDEPPAHYLLQAQVYAGLAGVEWCDLVWLTSGNKLARHQEAFRPALFEKIEARVAAFWADIRAGIAPKPDYTRDGDTIGELYADVTDEMVDLSRDNRAGLLAAEYLNAKAREKAAAVEAEAAKAELMEKLGTASVAMLDGYRIGCGVTKGSPGTLITGAHVGTTIGARKGYRRFDLKETI
jgi:predicted phage-related endonuclease